MLFFRGSSGKLCRTTRLVRNPTIMNIKEPDSKNQYWTICIIGKASRATVYRATFFPDFEVFPAYRALPEFEKIVAIKVFDNVEQNRQELQDRVFVADHPNILGIKTTFAAGDSLYVVMPFMDGGSLQSIISRRFQRGFSEECVRIALRETLKGLSHIHQMGLFHKYIDARYIFLCPYAPAIKLAFGASLYEQDSNFSSNYTMPLRSSSEPYCMWPAPEASVNYTIKADVWLVGITALQLRYGLDVDEESLKSMIRSAQEFIQVDSVKFSGNFRNMVAKCLDPDPSRRPEPEELLGHEFFEECFDVTYFSNFLDPHLRQ